MKYLLTRLKKLFLVRQSPKKINNTIADNHSLDLFYKQFEDRFRGDEALIKERIKEHKHIFDELDETVKRMPIVDLGCGRGEFLGFAQEAGLNAIGIDMNKDMVERANKLGYTAYESDAISYLSRQKDNSLAAVTGFHLVEHIPFESLMKMFEECYRTVSDGGLVLFETPNPQNITVGACNFYTDPSHIKPLPPPLLSFCLEYVGFEPTIINLHPSKNDIQHNDATIKNMMEIMYGPQDYAVVGKK